MKNGKKTTLKNNVKRNSEERCKENKVKSSQNLGENVYLSDLLRMYELHTKT